ncbi:hypothetical protein BDW22DRAFT_814393 [Trametopsis cervina]|nr:hypothetical protein BDW22DRAFT_814393 [Trametopsis cervina]
MNGALCNHVRLHPNIYDYFFCTSRFSRFTDMKSSLPSSRMPLASCGNQCTRCCRTSSQRSTPGERNGSSRSSVSRVGSWTHRIPPHTQTAVFARHLLGGCPSDDNRARLVDLSQAALARQRPQPRRAPERQARTTQVGPRRRRRTSAPALHRAHGQPARQPLR